MEVDDQVISNITDLYHQLEGTDQPFVDRTQPILRARELLCNASSYVPTNETASYCPKTFDSWTCWNETPPGTTAYALCPYFITGFDPKRMAHKECLENGTWFRHPESNVVWSNYTTCVDMEALERAQTVIMIYEVGYLISICTLVISLLIFCSFRCLECTRVSIHKNLFVSFIINNFLWLIWYQRVINGGIPSDQQNQGFCVTLHIFVQYFMVANYFWMFCEGFYLHTILVYSFTRAESKLLKGFYIFGWVGPAIPIALYGGFRLNDSYQEGKNDCWAELTESHWSLFLTVPVCFGLITCFAFLINILRVLLAKLNDNRRNFAANRRESHVGESQNALRKASRATLFLIPLLGLHYILIPFRPPPEWNEWTKIYQYFAAVSSSLQGLCVSVLFCFGNGEVLTVLRRNFCRHHCPGKRNCYRGEYSCAPTSMTVNKSPKHQLSSQSA